MGTGPRWTASDKILMQRAAAKLPGLAAGTLRVYISLLWDIHDSRTGFCAASAEKGSGESGLSEKGWRNGVRQLRELRIIDYERNSGGRSQVNHFVLNTLHGLPGLQEYWQSKAPLQPSQKAVGRAKYDGQKPGNGSQKPGTRYRRNKKNSDSNQNPRETPASTPAIGRSQVLPDPPKPPPEVRSADVAKWAKRKLEIQAGTE